MIVAVIGKGGVGKTTITALLLRSLLDARQVPVLAVDADPSNCLGPALGVTVSSTLAALRDGMRDDEGRPASMPKADWFAIRAEEALVEQPGFDLLTMGHPEGPGCYCFVNSVIRSHLERLGRTYRHVLIDCEAGLEHLSRRTSSQPDMLVSVVSRARMSAETVRRALALYGQLNGRLPARLSLVLNGFEAGEPLAAEMARLATPDGVTFERTTIVPWDADVARVDESSGALLAVSPSSRALQALAGWEAAG